MLAIESTAAADERYNVPAPRYRERPPLYKHSAAVTPDVDAVTAAVAVAFAGTGSEQERPTGGAGSAQEGPDTWPVETPSP